MKAKAASEWILGDPRNPATKVGTMIEKAHMEKVVFITLKSIFVFNLTSYTPRYLLTSRRGKKKVHVFTWEETAFFAKVGVISLNLRFSIKRATGWGLGTKV